MPRPADLDPTAVLGRRTGAFFIDVVLCALAGAAPALLLADAYSGNQSDGGGPVQWIEGDLAIFVRDTTIVLRGSELAVVGACLGAAILLFTVMLPGWRGWSPGGLAADIRVVNRQGEHTGFFRSLTRTVLWVIDILPGFALVGYVTARRTFRHQRVGDLVGGTYVVDKRAVGRPIDAPPERWADPVEVLEPEPEPEPQVEPAQDPEPKSGFEPPPGVPPDEPIWDRRHKRYVLWRSKTGQWLEHVDDEWRPVEAEAPPEG